PLAGRRLSTPRGGKHYAGATACAAPRQDARRLPAPRQLDEGARAVGGLLGREPVDRLGHLLRPAATTQRQRGREPLDAARLAAVGMHLGEDAARAHGIDADALAGDL